MADAKHVSILRGGVSTWNEWRRKNPKLRIDLSGTNFGEIDLRGANLQNVDLSDVDFHTAIFTDPGIYESTAQTHRQSCQANFRGANMCRIDLHGVDLCETDLSLTNLSQANLLESDLRNAKFNESDLASANLMATDLRRANLHRANLQGANLRSSSLIGADISGSTLIQTNLVSANLSDSDLSNAKFYETILANVDLTNVRGLELCSHAGPSFLDHMTIERSHDINIKFLQGVGLPDYLINTAIRHRYKYNNYYSCFICYSNKDTGFAKRLHDDLQSRGVRCWFAPEDMKAGKKIIDQIDTAISYHEKLLLILSDNSINSEWVKTEIHKARRREKQEGCRILFPIKIVDYNVIKHWECFDADIGKDSAQEIREYYIRDFSHWEDKETYRVELDNLLRDLNRDNE
jgi:uncharacterized protein YjbI with pentapeptide repeats